ncbi:acetamidase/formamidase family protein [Streptomyces cavernae]|uniref:acetamidase/formamidase family protein n=1 Tax=Streptomyces cavernae TaxID=2259034 RepID=UPI000FEBAE45|nr:acetamidase/formamidase family protein [Streptomyces cavernae]
MNARASQGFPVLQSGTGIAAGRAYLPAEPPHVLWGRLPCRDDKPVATVFPGQSIIADTVSHEGILEDQGSDPVAFFGRHGIEPGQVLSDTVEIAARRRRDTRTDGPHVVTGPVAVVGARPGDLLAVHVDALEMRAPYGVVSTRHGRGVLAGNPLVDAGYSTFCRVIERGDGWAGALPTRRGGTDQATFALRPFLGIMGVATDTSDRAHSVPPGMHGGNMDIKLLTSGSTLFLPVQVPEALLYIGDPHYAQGDGEVALTALEAPLRAHLTVDVIPRAEVTEHLGQVRGPFAAADGFLIPTGMDLDLNVALRRCVTNAVNLLVACFGMEPRQAYLYLSAAGDFHISQAVDLVAGVHGTMNLADFATVSPTALGRRVLESVR